MENAKNTKKMLMSKPIPMLPFKNIAIGSITTVIPWTILLLIVGFIMMV